MLIRRSGVIFDLMVKKICRNCVSYFIHATNIILAPWSFGKRGNLEISHKKQGRNKSVNRLKTSYSGQNIDHCIHVHMYRRNQHKHNENIFQEYIWTPVYQCNFKNFISLQFDLNYHSETFK